MSLHTGSVPVPEAMRAAAWGDASKVGGRPRARRTRYPKPPKAVLGALRIPQVRRVVRDAVKQFRRSLRNPVQVELRGRSRIVSVFGVPAYAINEARREIRPLVSEAGCAARHVKAQFEIGNPLSRSSAIEPFLRPWRVRLRAAIGYEASMNRKAERLCAWLARCLWTMLLRRGFLRVVREEIDRALDLDPEVVLLALRSNWPGCVIERRYGPLRFTVRRAGMLSADHYCRVWQNLETWSRVFREAPKLLPLLTAAYRAGFEPSGERVLQRVRGRFMAAGGTPRAWRYLSNAGVSRLRVPGSLGSRSDPLTVLALVSRVYVELDLDRAPRARSTEERLLGYVVEEVLDRPLQKVTMKRELPLVRRALPEAERRARAGTLGAFLRSEFLEVAACWRALECSGVRKVHAGAWPEFREGLTRLAHSLGGCGTSWKSAVGTFQEGGYSIVPLISEPDLLFEGSYMNHCAGSLAFLCEAGSSRVFSIRSGATGARVATLRISRWGLTWKVADISGVSNRPVSAKLKALASSVARRYSWAHLRSLPALMARRILSSARACIPTLRTISRRSWKKPIWAERVLTRFAAAIANERHDRR